MFVNFRQTFERGSDGVRTGLPSAVIEELSKSLPKDVRYYPADNGMLCIGPEQGAEMHLGGFAPKITKDMRKVLGGSPSPSDVFGYSYNAQKPIKLELIDPGFVTVNGEKIALDDAVKILGDDFKLEAESFVAYPEAFPPPFSIEVSTSDGSSALALTVRRVPNESVDVAKYESDSREPFVMEYSVLEPGDAAESGVQVSYNFSVHPERCATLSDVVDVLNVFESFSRGSGKIANIPLEQAGAKEMDVDYDFGALPWLKKAREIESALGIMFDPKAISLTPDSICAIAELYAGLIKRSPTRTPQSHARVNVDEDAARSIEERMAESPSGLMALAYSSTLSYNLFGQEIVVQSFCGLFNLAISEVRKTENGMREIGLAERSGGAKGYISRLLFKSEGELDEFLDRASMGDIVKQLQEASLPLDPDNDEALFSARDDEGGAR